MYSLFFYFLQNLSNPLLFTHCCCYSKKAADLKNYGKNRKKMSIADLNFQPKKVMDLAWRLN